MTADLAASAPQPENSPSQSAADARLYRPALALIVLLCAGLRVWLLLTARATEEDFYITLRYAENIAHGQGFVYNAGQWTLGTTTPLYTLLLAFCLRLGLNAPLTGKLLAIGAECLAGVAIFRLGRAVGRPGAGLAAALCLAVAPVNLIWATKGMEVELVAGATALLWMAWAERREGLAWASAGVLVLLRIDGLAAVAVLLAATLIRDRRPPWRGLALFLALTLPWFAFATWRFGSPLPASLRAKWIVYGWRVPARFPNLAPFLRLMTRNPLSAFLFAGAAIFVLTLLAALLRRRGSPIIGPRAAVHASEVAPASLPLPPETILLAPLAALLLHYGGMAFSKVYLFGWYFVPPTPLYYLVAMTGWTMAVARIFPGALSRWRGTGRNAAGAGGRAAGLQIALLAAVMGGAASGFIAPRVARDLRQGQAVENDLRIPIGRWLRAQARPSDTMMLEPIGYIGYYSGLRVLDVIGLVSPEVLFAYQPEVASPEHVLWTRFQPEWVLLRAGEWQALTAYEAGLPEASRLTARYAEVRTWDNPGGGIAFRLFRRRM